jgi:hypothetical protein
VLDNTDQYFANFQSVPQTSQTLAENLVHPKTDSSSHAETIQAAILQASNIRCKADRIHACISSPPPHSAWDSRGFGRDTGACKVANTPKPIIVTEAVRLHDAC